MNKKKNYAKLEKEIVELKKRVAALEGPVQAQSRKFIPEDSEHGICKNTVPVERP